MALPIRLHEISPGIRGRTWSGTDVLRIGRQKDLEIMLEDASISRLHAEIRPSEQGWQVIDCGSTNGTWLNGARLGFEPRHIRVRDIIQFGRSAMVVESNKELWLTGNDPFPMLEFLRPHASVRKLRLYSVAVCRQIRESEWCSAEFSNLENCYFFHAPGRRHWRLGESRSRKASATPDFLSRVVERAEEKISGSCLFSALRDWLDRLA